MKKLKVLFSVLALTVALCRRFLWLVRRVVSLAGGYLAQRHDA